MWCSLLTRSPRRSASTPAASAESARATTCICPVGALRTTMLNVRERRVLVRDSRRGSGRRGSPCARARSGVIASDTVSRLRRSSAVCQPGLYSRLPVTPALRGRSLQRLELAERAACISSSRRTMPTRSCIMSCRSCWIWNGFSAAVAALERRQRARCRASTWPLVDARCAVLFAQSRPRTRRRACRRRAGRTASCRRAGSRR